MLGVSFNCYVGNNTEIGGCDEQQDISFIGQDINKLVEYVIEDAKEQDLKYQFYDKHDYVGQACSVGGNVIGVFVDIEAKWVDAVLIADPKLPLLVE
jgi:hypothetical protein